MRLFEQVCTPTETLCRPPVNGFILSPQRPLTRPPESGQKLLYHSHWKPTEERADAGWAGCRDPRSWRCSGERQRHCFLERLRTNPRVRCFSAQSRDVPTASTRQQTWTGRQLAAGNQDPATMTGRSQEHSYIGTRDRGSGTSKRESAQSDRVSWREFPQAAEMAMVVAVPQGEVWQPDLRLPAPQESRLVSAVA